MLNKTLFVLVPLTLTLGCEEPGPSPNDDWQATTQVDAGAVCVKAESADSNGSVSVDGELCLSSSCSRDIVGSCDATLDGNTITVTSQFDWEENVGQNVPCTYDCVTLVAECGEVGPLPAGTYTVVHGDETNEVVVPNGGGC